MSERLSKTDIIRSQKEFEHLFREGRRIYGKYVFMIYQPYRPSQPDAPQSRAAFIAGRRYGKAVERNRMKRRLREIFRRNRQAFAHFQVLLIAQRGPFTGSFQTLRQEVLQLAAKMQSDDVQ